MLIQYVLLHIHVASYRWKFGQCPDRLKMTTRLPPAGRRAAAVELYDVSDIDAVRYISMQ